MVFKYDIKYRKQSLLKLLLCIESKEAEIIKALHDDFKKPAFETILSETGFIRSELHYTIKNINKSAKPTLVLPSLLNFPSTDYIYKEPYGKVLIIAPWNYPYQLVMAPLIAAIAAGNQVVLKPSELTPNTSRIIAEIIRFTFDKNHVHCIEGGAEVTTSLLKERWDYIFFTGSVTVGKVVAKAAAEHLTPITLELGGKNPCIIEESANLKLAAKRIVWGKFLNAGQTCIAPDYIVVQKKVKAKLVDFLKEEITFAYGQQPESSPDFARIINEKNWKRLVAMLENETIVFGGKTIAHDHYIAPTVLDEPATTSLVMQEEIFGPILPILSFESITDLDQIITSYEKPLSLYVFTSNKAFAQKICKTYSFGGGAINDTIVQFANKRLPFGGVGQSGIGAYHGKLSYDVFSHQKAVVKKATWLDIPFRYAPYRGKINLIKVVMKWFS